MESFLAQATAALTGASGIAYAAAVLAVLALTAALRRLPPVFFLAVFPGTLLHELAHLAVGALTNGRPAGLRLWPRRAGHGWILGAVQCANVRWYNGLFIGLAPLIWLPAAGALLLWRVQAPPALTPQEGAWVYAIACLAYGALPSWQDLRTALATSWPLVLAGIGAALWWSGIVRL